MVLSRSLTWSPIRLIAFAQKFILDGLFVVLYNRYTLYICNQVSLVLMPYLRRLRFLWSLLASQPLGLFFGFRGSIRVLRNSISPPSIPALDITCRVPSSH